MAGSSYVYGTLKLLRDRVQLSVCQWEGENRHITASVEAQIMVNYVVGVCSARAASGVPA